MSLYSAAGSLVKGSKFLNVVRAERRGVFLHLLCYRSADLDAIDQLMAEIAYKLEVMPPVQNALDLRGQMMAVRIDGVWLRASAYFNGTVQLFDLGIKKNVDLDDIRLATPEMQGPKITFWCVLSNFFAHCGQNDLEEVMQYSVLEIKTTHKVCNTRFAELLKDGRPLELWLEKQNFGVTTTFDEQEEFFKLERHEETALAQARSQSLQYLDNEPTDALFMQATRLLPMHVRVAARVVSATRGPKLFNIQLDQHRSLISMLSSIFELSIPLRNVPREGQPCVAPIPGGTGYTRGLVTACEGVMANVQLIDLNMTTVLVELAKLKELPYQLHQIPPLVVPVSLVGSERFAESASKAFLPLVVDQESNVGRDLDLTIVGKEGAYQIGKLQSPVMGNILNFLSERIASKAYAREELQVGQRYMVQILGLRERQEVWSLCIRLASNKQNLEQLHEKVDHFCKSRNPGSHQMFCGDPVFAKCEENNKWMRAVVIECHGRTSRVLFVDSGLESEAEEVRTADPDLVTSLKAQAIECYLNGFEINSKAVADIKKLIGSKLHVVQPIDCLENNIYRVSLSDPSTYPPTDIAEELQTGLQRHVSMTSVESVSNASSVLHQIFQKAPNDVQVGYVTSTRIPSIPCNDDRSSAVSIKSNRSDQFDAVIQRRRSTPVDRPGIPEIRSDPALKLNYIRPSPSTCADNGLRRKQSIPDEEKEDFNAKKTRIDSVPQEAKNLPDYTSMLVYPSCKFNATLSWMVNPSKFYVQPLFLSEGLEQLMESIGNVHPENLGPLKSVARGQPCLAKYDGCWYRARVMDIVNNQAEVFFVDFGNSSKVKLASDVRPIVNLQLTEPPTMAVPCSLRGVIKTNWTEKETDDLHKMIENEKFMVEVRGIWNDTYSVVIIKDSTNINLSLHASENTLEPLTYVPPMRVIQEIKCAKISWFVNPNNFYLQPKEYEEKSQLLQKQCNNCFKGCSMIPTKVKVGSFLLAKCSDGNYARVVVKEIRDDQARVTLIDHGRTIIIKIADLHPLPDQLHAVEMHVLHCSLYDIQPHPDKMWPKAGQCPEIDNLFKSPCIEYKLVQKDKDVMQVNMYIGKQDLADMLICMNVARRISTPPPPQRKFQPVPVPTNLTTKRCFNVASFDSFPHIFVSDGESQKNISFINAQLSLPLEKLQHKLQPDELCAVKFSMNSRGSEWHRAKLTFDNNFFLIDHGITVSVIGKECKSLPRSLEEIPPQVLHAYVPVFPPKGEDHHSKDVVATLKELVCAGKPEQLQCQVIGSSGNKLYLDLLTPDCIRAVSLLEKENLMRLNLKQVTISHYNSVRSVYLQEDQDMVEWVQEQLLKPTNQIKEELATGQLCVAEFEGCKYRAKLLGNHRVLFVDYGNEDDAHLKWQLDPELEAIPFLARKYCLKGAQRLTMKEEYALEKLMSFEEQYLAVMEANNEVILFKDGKDLVETVKEKIVKTEEKNMEEAPTKDDIKDLPHEIAVSSTVDTLPVEEITAAAETKVELRWKIWKEPEYLDDGAITTCVDFGLQYPILDPVIRSTEKIAADRNESKTALVLQNSKIAAYFAAAEVKTMPASFVEPEDETKREEQLEEYPTEQTEELPILQTKEQPNEQTEEQNTEQTEKPPTEQAEEQPTVENEEQPKEQIEEQPKEQIIEEQPKEENEDQPSKLNGEQLEVKVQEDNISSSEMGPSSVKGAETNSNSDGFARYYVSSVTSSLEFYLQADPDVVATMSQQLVLQADYPLSDLAKDELCAALNDDNGQWGRAQILSLRPPTGFFFDTGHVAQIGSFKLLNQEQLNKEPMAVRCALKAGLTEGAVQENQWIWAKVDEEGMVELKNMSWRDATVTYYESHCELYLRPLEEDLHTMEAQLGEGPDVPLVAEGQMYAAPNDHGGWSRARVTNIAPEGCGVFFVDYGHYGQSSTLKALAPVYMSRPEAAILCFLKPVPPPEARDKIKQILQPGVQVQVGRLDRAEAAQGVSIKVNGKDLMELVSEMPEAEAEKLQEGLDDEAEEDGQKPDLRPEADAFVPLRNWSAAGCRILTKYGLDVVNGWQEVGEEIGQLLRLAVEMDSITPEGEELLEESFTTLRINGTESTGSTATPIPSPDPAEPIIPVVNGIAPIVQGIKGVFKLSPAKLILPPK